MKIRERVLNFISVIGFGLALFISLPNFSYTASPGNVKSPDAVKELMEGKRSEANAAWWGFDENDATEALQEAINSGARKVVVPNMGKDWFVRPIRLAGNQEIVFEKGAVITAKRGEFRAKGDCLFRAVNISNLTIRGYGALFRMQKQDYMLGDRMKGAGWQPWYGVYERSEWRHTLSISGSANVTVLGLTLRESGGDGIYIDGKGDKYSRNIHIRDVVCDDHYRQGISVCCVDSLLVENSVFSNTWGTPPCAGVDIEPYESSQRVSNIVFRKCTFENNFGNGVHVWLDFSTPGVADDSMRFENCRITSRKGSGIYIGGINDAGPTTRIEFISCRIENTEGYGFEESNVSASRTRIRLVDTVWENVSRNESYDSSRAPLIISMSPDGKITRQCGGLEFVNCLVKDTKQRPFLIMTRKDQIPGLADVAGTIRVNNPKGVSMDLGTRTTNVTLKVLER